MTVRAVLYDLDGLLLDSETAGLVSWREVYAAHGCELDLAHWLGEVAAGRGPVMPKRQLEEQLGRPVDWDEVERGRLARRDGLLVARPGALQHVAAARALGLRTALVSNAPAWWVGQQLPRLGVPEPQFDVIVTGEPGLARKPAPDAYLKALRELGVAAEAALAFEDSPVGITAAQSAGIRCVAVANEVTANLDLSAADLILPALDARPLRSLLEELLSPAV
ncbi:MAG TPA: HAD-IA family hydrolase [Actinocrinis sp.]|uniref:HAD family hydrolase n=1 Tax=Actinocrinis sp. TaxID=1920516 RepID=UPI002DDD6696|nr:HAD-IA family hydrolase [Actinocrinis sp.]HEV2342915.1 HAD-IA family hydrolase [Actinocrinis sp.]